jgi:hypothetical protein
VLAPVALPQCHCEEVRQMSVLLAVSPKSICAVTLSVRFPLFGARTRNVKMEPKRIDTVCSPQVHSVGARPVRFHARAGASTSRALQ